MIQLFLIMVLKNPNSIQKHLKYFIIVFQRINLVSIGQLEKKYHYLIQIVLKPNDGFGELIKTISHVEILLFLTLIVKHLETMKPE